jgi:hypothetical protein
MEITVSQFAELLRNRKGCSFASVDYQTECRELYARENGCRKHSTPKCPATHVRKVGKGIMLGADYGNRVSNQRVREGVVGEFKPETPRGYDHVGGLLAITKKGHQGMLYSLPKAGTDQAVNGVKSFINVDGDIVADSELVKFRKPAKVYESRQGTDDLIHWRCIKIENIIAIRFDGVEYEITADAEVDAGEEVEF